MKKTFIFSILFFSILSLSAQNAIYPLSQQRANADALIYYLPKSEVLVVAQAEQTIEKPGPFFRYAERYLGITDVITRERNSYQLAQIEISTQQVADPSKGYVVEIGKKGIAPLLTLMPDRVLFGVNLPFDYQLSKPIEPIASQPDTTITFDLSLLGEEALMANSVPKMAEMAAKQIYRIREARMAFLTGESERMPDGLALQEILTYLDRTEKELMALFVGKRKVLTTTSTFPVAVNGALTNYIVFRLSTLKGILPADDLMGSPIYLTLKPEMVIAPTSEKGKEKKVVATGYTFNNPGYALVTITDNRNLNIQQRLPMPQFGTVESLPVGLCNDAQLRILYDVNTGSIEKLAY